MLSATAWSRSSENNVANINNQELVLTASSRPATAAPIRNEIFYRTSNSAYSTFAKSSGIFKNPKYIELDQKVCRFYGYFLQPRIWDKTSALGEPTVETEQCRHVTILYYLVDDTVEINEKKVINSGLCLSIAIGVAKACIL
jgi:hypothetical protein